MKNLKSKLAFVLVLAMAATTALAAPVFAATTGDGTIAFDEGTGGIVDPPDDTDFSKISDAAIDFGTNEIASTTQIYNSITYNQANTTTTSPHAANTAVHTSTDANLDYAGVYVENPTLSGFKVFVRVGGFVKGTTATMAGAVLTLTADPLVQLSTKLTDTTFVQSLALPAIDGSTDALILSGPAGCNAGANWEGDLTVLGGTVKHTGQATAIMTWTFANV